MDFHRRVMSRVFIATLSGDFNDIADHVLSLFSKNAGDICRRAGAECNEQ